MANVKISQLPTASAVTGDDFLPIVDSGSTTTQQASFQQVLDYVTGSTFNDLTVVSLSASILYVESSIVDSTGSTKFGDTSDDTHQFTGSVYVSQNIEATQITGSVVSASNFYGDGSGITGVTGEWDGTHTGNAEITGTLSVENGNINITQNAYFLQGTTTGASTVGLIGVTSGDQIEIGNQGLLNKFVDDVWVSGNVGIGTSTPAASLHIETDGTATSPQLIVSSLGATDDASMRFDAAINAFTIGVDDSGNGSFVISDGNALQQNQRFLIDRNTGRVGIQQTSPLATLDVNGDLIANVALSGSVGSEIQVSSYSLSAADRGKTLIFSSSATQGITCSSGLDVGFSSTFIQYGSGQLELSAAAGVTILNRQSHTKTAGTYAAASVVIISSDVYLFSGDTSA